MNTTYGVWCDPTESWEIAPTLHTLAAAKAAAAKVGGSRHGMYPAAAIDGRGPVDPRRVAREQARAAAEAQRQAQRAALLGSFAAPRRQYNDQG